MIESHVTNLELSKRLKELGVKQESFFCYREVKDSEPVVWPRSFNLDEMKKPSKGNHVAAFLCSEIFNMLPKAIFVKNITLFLKIQIVTLIFLLEYSPEGSYIITCKPVGISNNLLDAATEILIHIIENNLVTDEWKKEWLV